MCDLPWRRQEEQPEAQRKREDKGKEEFG